MTVGRFTFTALVISGRKEACRERVMPGPSSQAIPPVVPTSFTSSFLELDTCRFISPDAPSCSGVPVSGSIRRTFSGVPHLRAICTVLLMKYTSEWKVPSVSVWRR